MELCAVQVNRVRDRGDDAFPSDRSELILATVVAEPVLGPVVNGRKLLSLTLTAQI